MTIHRVYFPGLLQEDSIKLSKEKSHHLKNVLSIKEGEKVILFNGKGISCLGLVGFEGKKIVNLEIIKDSFEEGVKPEHLVLMISILKNQAMERVFRMATELGVKEIIPVITKNSTVALKVALQKIHRWEKIVISASEQSKRDFLPTIISPLKLMDGLDLIKDYENKILFYEKSENLENYRLKKGKKVVFIGPEGGISDHEVDILKKNGFLDFSMGEYVMKADTAVICAISTVKSWLKE